MAFDIIERWKASSIASALSTALTIYPCQIRVHQRWQSKLQLSTARKKEWRPATADSSPHAVTCQHCDTHYFSRPRTRNLPIVGWLLVNPLPVVPPTHHTHVSLLWLNDACYEHKLLLTAYRKSYMRNRSIDIKMNDLYIGLEVVWF